MTSNHSDQAPIHSVPDAAVNLQCGGAPPSPPDLGTSQVLPQPHDPPTTGPTVSNQDQETKGDAGIMAHEPEALDLQPVQDGGPVPEQSEGSAVSHWAHDFLDRMPLLNDLSHLPRDDLNRVARYVFNLGQEAGLPINEVEGVSEHIIMMGNHNRWDIDTIEGVAREVVNDVANWYKHHRGPPAPHHGNLVVLLCCVVCGGVVGVVLGTVVHAALCAVSVIWGLLYAGLRDLCSFTVASVSVNTLGIAAYVLIFVVLIYLLVKEERAEAQEEGLRT